MSKSFENGQIDAKLDSIVQSLDRIRERLDRLPCTEHTKCITANRSGIMAAAAVLLFRMMPVIYHTVSVCIPSQIIATMTAEDKF